MEEELKKEFWKVFQVAAFLFLTIFFVLPYLVQISTYFHEKAHVKVLTKYSIRSEYNVNLLETIPIFFNPKVNKLGITRFDVDQYKRLSKTQKAEIHIAGIISDLRFLFLIGIYLSVANVYVYYKVRFKKEYDLRFVLAVNWILFMWLLALVQITASNITFAHGDILQLLELLC